MRAFILDSFGERLHEREIATPRISAGEVLVRVKACGIGLTLSWIRLGRMGASLPRIIGHEISGIVEEVGGTVPSIKKGDSVAVYFYLTCGKCKYCLSDRETICANFGGNVGTKVDGGLAEFVKLPASNLFKFPETRIPFEKASIISDAIATPLHIAKRRAVISPNDKVAIFGAGGGVGIHMVQMARVFGAEVFAIDISDEKLELAGKLGAAHLINSMKQKVSDSLRELTNGGGVDSAIDFVSSPETTLAAYESLGRQGRLVLLGHFHPSEPLRLGDPQDFIRKELTVLGSRYATRQEFREAIEMVEKGLIEPIVTKIYNFPDSDRALSDVEKGMVAGRAVVTMT